MSQPLPERADIRQLRIQAKELLQKLQTSDPSVKLADAQRQIARDHGFASWPRLVAQVETPQLIERLKTLIETGKIDDLEKLLKTKSVLRSHLNDSLFSFDSPPILRAVNHPDAKRLLPLLVRYGADANGRSTWWAGGFGALDHAKGETVDLLVSLGTRWDIWSASAHGRADLVREMLKADPSLANAPGGDGQRPLHFAKTVEVASILLDAGADLEQRDVDHESTPAQVQINNPEVLRLLIQRGAKPDIFMATVLDDPDLFHRVLNSDPEAALAHVGSPPFVTHQSNGGHHYLYALGGGKTPLLIAAERGSHRVLAELSKRVTPAQRMVAAAWADDAKTVHSLIGAPIGPDEKGAVAMAAQAGKTETVRLLLEAGFDPLGTGMDSGTSLHIACWFGYEAIVNMLVDKVPLDTRDAHHGSPPLGWACHGAHWCRNAKGDYPAIVEMLIAAGADPKASANSGGTSMIQQAGNREDVKEVLRRYGAI